MSRRSRSVIDLGSGAVSRDVSSDESDTDVRISIDQINLDSSDDEGQEVVDKKKGKVAVKGAGASGEKGLRPIRVERHEHEERVVSVNMESSSSKSAELREQAKGKAAEDDALFVQDDDESPAQQPETEPKVKPEPTDDDDQHMADVAPHADESMITDDGFLPVQTVKVRRKLDSKEPSEPPVVKEEKSLLRTKEDIEEYERHAQDLLVIKDLLWKEPPAPAAEAKEPNAEQPEASTSGPDVAATESEKDGEKPEGEEAEKKDEEEAEDKLSGQLFLMQFPPMTPNLVAPGEASSAPTENATEAAPPQQPTGETAPQPDAPVKQEYGVEVLDGPDESSATREPPRVVTATDWQLNAGRVGKLNVHASGRVTMTWGGISFELDRATAVDFLQEAVIASTPPGASVEDEPEEERKVWAMGQLSGKFTVMPNWGEML
ncbi:putative DNA-directed RNA polymerase III RPC4 [Aspergillus candidus]|uniref:RNA polymerase III RPC4-domain-containing protein n=1 Tax=Aspergillus candidus TaxID=41067 RepID=A0A2I2F9Q5_ASPCN|nr:RNA polymerase III RPC4-domain-containing protein [Aspergillus candidus]PLB37338.1 RNA polymerase III RPC4-domain-containing protein [Aspergillus candidus]